MGEWRGLRVAGHPLHPVLVHLPVGCWLASGVGDVLAVASVVPGAATFAFWALAVGTAGALPTLVTGYLEEASLPDGHPAERTARWHQWVMLTVTGLFSASLLLRGSPGLPATDLRSLAALALSAIALLALLLGSWLGGELVYRYGVGRSLSPPESQR